MREETITSCLLAALLVACNGGAEHPEPGASLQVGQAAPEIDARKVTGSGPTTLAEARGKVVILDFWATFCDPCKRSFPVYEQLVEHHTGDVAVLAVSLDTAGDVQPDDLVKFAEDAGASFSILWDEEKKTEAVYQPRAMPTAYILDRNGIIQHIHARYEASYADEIEVEVSALLE